MKHDKLLVSKFPIILNRKYGSRLTLYSSLRCISLENRLVSLLVSFSLARDKTKTSDTVAQVALKANTSRTVRRKFYQHLSNLDNRLAKAKRGNKVRNEVIIEDGKSQSSPESNSKIPPAVGSDVEPQLD